MRLIIEASCSLRTGLPMMDHVCCQKLQSRALVGRWHTGGRTDQHPIKTALYLGPTAYLLSIAHRLVLPVNVRLIGGGGACGGGGELATVVATVAAEMGRGETEAVMVEVENPQGLDDPGGRSACAVCR